MPAGLDPARTDAGLGVGQVGEHALAVFQERAAFMRERQAAGGADQQLHAQAALQCVQAPADDSGGHVFCPGSGDQTAPRCHGGKGFNLLEFVHDSVYFSHESMMF